MSDTPTDDLVKRLRADIARARGIAGQNATNARASFSVDDIERLLNALPKKESLMETWERARKNVQPTIDREAKGEFR